MKIKSIELSSNQICPNCGSNQVSFGSSHTGAGLQAECRSCGFIWR